MRRYKFLITFLALALPLGLAAVPGLASAAPAVASARSGVTSTSLFTVKPTFAGPAATGCAAGCSLLTGPLATPSTRSLALGAGQTAGSATAARNTAAAGAVLGSLGEPRGRPLPSPVKPRPAAPGARASAGQAGASSSPGATAPAVSCAPLGPGCAPVSRGPGGAVGVKGLNAVDSATTPTNPLGQDIEPPDQGLCAGNGSVVEDTNIGQVLVFDTSLHRKSQVIPLDTIMGLTTKGWSSGGDVSCLYDHGNGGHWFFTEFASASTEASGGPFSGCFNNVANTCFEAIAVTQGNSPFGPYNVYYLNANYNPAEPGAPFLLNDFTKIGVTGDAFLLFYDEFPLVTPGIGGGGFNGAQEFAFDKNAMERGAPVTLRGGRPNPGFNVAIENMGTLPTPDGTCASDNKTQQPGITCWFSVIPALAPDAGQFDNSHGGSGFMLDTLDFYGTGDSRVAAFDWTGLSSLNGNAKGVRFGGQLFSGTDSYSDFGLTAPQKAGPIPLGDECGAAGLSTAPPASCPEGAIATNGDNFTQVGQAQGQLWGAISTQVTQSFRGAAAPEAHLGAAYFVIGTRGFDSRGTFTFTSQSYVSPAHEDLTMPVMGPADNSGAIIAFTLTGDGGPTGADGGGFFPSTAFARLTATSGGILGPVHVADPGQAPQDGFSEYLGFPGPLSPRWGDYSAAVFDAQAGKVYFANEYIQHPNCAGADFTLTLATCGGTRDGLANWGTSVNSVTP
jgi:hypothetical protein